MRFLGLEGAESVQLDGVSQARSDEGPAESAPSDAPSSADAEENPLPQVDFSAPFKAAKENLVDAFEREYLERLLERAHGKIAVAAREAGLNRKYFYDLLNKHGLHRSKS
jgi:DNA-binding NtrC family response regulator